MNRLQPCLLAVLVLLGGCVSVPRTDTVSTARAGLPPAWRASAGHADDTAELADWWNGFADAQLRALIERALARNYDLKAAAERSRQAQALVTVARASLWPQVDLGADAVRQRSHLPPPAGIVTATGIGATGSWTIDIFGGNQLTALAAAAQAAATEEARSDFEVALTATLASTYAQLRGLQRQLQILGDNIAARSDTLQLTRVRYQAGLATDLDVSRAATQLQQVQASVPDVQRRIDADLGALSILTGDPPETVDPALREPAPIPLGAPALPAQAPAQLLERRPDLREAAHRIDLAAANLGTARADLLPKFTLTFGDSIDRARYRGLPALTDNLFNLGLGVFWPLFDAGRIRAHIVSEDAALRQAEYAFEQTLLNALQDVETAYDDVRAQRQRSALLSLAADSARHSSTLAQDLYNAGEADFLSVLDAHTQVLDTERELVQAQTDAAVGAVALFRALGGGWRPTAGSAASPAMAPSDQGGTL